MYFSVLILLAYGYVINNNIDLPWSGPIIWDRHEPLYASTAAVSNYYNILHLQDIPFREKKKSKKNTKEKDVLLIHPNT